jgi:hypothetical protein
MLISYSPDKTPILNIYLQGFAQHRAVARSCLFLVLFRLQGLQPMYVHTPRECGAYEGIFYFN